ncbi:hypothetical protein PAMP_018766 [Pampus punctatissimus]
MLLFLNKLVPGGRTVQVVPENVSVFENIPLAVTPKRGAVSNVSQASLVQAVCSHATAQVEDHVTRGLETCSAGRYGESCRLTCDCGGAPCDPITGQCICPAGKTGDSCQEDCALGLWGMRCQSLCPPCKNGGSCHKQSGVCDCRPGFTGTLCQNACESGYWGQGCISKCQCQESSLGCDSVTGQCVCEAGFTGDYCERKCVNGTYGQGCVQQCQCQSGALCDHVSGACTCSPGYAGTFCEKSLLPSNRGVQFLSLLLGPFLQEKSGRGLHFCSPPAVWSLDLLYGLTAVALTQPGIWK